MRWFLNPGAICMALFAWFFGGFLSPPLLAAELDPSKLTAPASVQIDFARDIKPIIDTSCIRCHGPEKPRSGFRLDNQAAALKGGENGVDIVPGNSAKSPLVYYVSRLVPDMEMPPEGKGQPLTTNQVALLRAWIDQGASWGNVIPTNVMDVSYTPFGGWTFISGDKHNFRELYWQHEGANGGLDRFEIFQQNGPDTTETITGHALLNDYKITLDFDRSDRAFVHTGWEQYRKYYDDLGGVARRPDTQFPERLGSDLYLDLGKAWFDFGVTLPHWPRLVWGYEYDYKHGNEAITSWQSDGRPSALNIGPASKYLQEGTHVIKFDLDAEVHGITIEDRFRGEFYKLTTHYTNVAARAPVSQDAREHDSYFQGANSIRLEKKFNDWSFGSAGYLYSKLTASDSFTNNSRFFGLSFPATVPDIMLVRESHVFNLNGLLGPFDGLTISAGAQSEWTRQQGLGSGDLNQIFYTRSAPLNLAVNPATLLSDYQQNTISETLGLRYTKIPFTALFADARLQQETIDQTDNDLQPAVPGGSFAENPSFSSRLSDLRVGFNTSPWQAVSWSAHYRRYEDDSRYKTNEVPQPAGGYPGLISWRDLLTDEVETKLVLRPCSWVKTTLTYQYLTTVYKQDTRTAFDPTTLIVNSPGGRILAGTYDSHIYSLGNTVTPLRRLSISSTFSYQDTTTVTENAGLVPPYKGGVYSALLSGTYLFSDKTDLLLNYSFSFADYTQGDFSTNPLSPPPVGSRYQQHAFQAVLSHRISKSFTTRLQYGYYYYNEPTLAGAADFRANAIFGMLTYHFR
jgi:mono/diheme cytochrome c family protein